jgi:acyl-CoA thioesterase-1
VIIYKGVRWILVVLFAAACAGSEPARDSSNEQSSAPVSANEGAAELASSQASARESADAERIVFIGTSLTAGLGLAPEQSYPALIQEKLDSAGLKYIVENAGQSGETSAGALSRLPWLLDEPAAVYVIETGANDGVRGLSVPAMKANIQAMIDTIRAREPGAAIVLAAMEAPPNLGLEYTSDFRKAYVDLAEENEVEYLPFLLAGVAANPELNQSDGMHPNVRGELVVARNVWRALLPVLESREGAPARH